MSTKVSIDPAQAANFAISLSLVRYLQLTIGRDSPNLEGLLRESLDQAVFAEGSVEKRAYDNAIHQAIKMASDAREISINLAKR